MKLSIIFTLIIMSSFFIKPLHADGENLNINKNFWKFVNEAKLEKIKKGDIIKAVDEQIVYLCDFNKEIVYLPVNNSNQVYCVYVGFERVRRD